MSAKAVKRRPWNYEPPVIGHCPTCSEPFSMPAWQYRTGRRFCSAKCGNPARGTSGPSNGRWRGGRRVRPDGYVELNIGGVIVLEHRHVMQQEIGRPLRSDEHVHHKNHVRSDNRPENLEVLTHSQHSALHARRGPRETCVKDRCGACGAEVIRHPSHARRFARAFCNRACWRAHKAGAEGAR